MRGQDFAGQDFAGQDFVGQDFAGQDFAGQDLNLIKMIRTSALCSLNANKVSVSQIIMKKSRQNERSHVTDG